MRLSPHLVTFPLYLPRIHRTISNWPEYLYSYLLRRRRRAEYRFRNGQTVLDDMGRLAGTIAAVCIRQEYGPLGPFRSIVDIGANVGVFAIYAASECPEAKIYCYEPERLNFALLRRNISANGLSERITGFPLAVAREPGQRDLAISLPALHSLVIEAGSSSRQRVSCATLSDIFEDLGLETLDLLKINCEGAEYEIFAGCSAAILRRISHIRMEYHNLDGGERNGEALLALLRRHGYTIQRFSRYLNESGFIWASRS